MRVGLAVRVRPRRARARVLLRGLAALLAGCGGEGRAADGPNEDAPYDPAPGSASTTPERVVSLLPAATEILVELGAGGRLVALAEGDPLLGGRLRAADGAQMPSVGAALDPSLEVLTASAPDLIVAWTGSEAATLGRTLAPEGTLLLLDIQGFDDLRAAVDTLGAVLGLTDEAAALNGRIAGLLQEASRVASGTAARIAWIVWPDPLTLAGPGSFPDEVLRIAGGVNVVRDGEGSWPAVGLETLIARDPDILVWPRGGGIPGPGSVADTWRRIPAFEAGRVLRLPADTVHVPGPGLARMMPAVADRVAELERRLAEIEGGATP